MRNKEFAESFKGRYRQFSDEVCRERRHFLSESSMQFLNDLTSHLLDEDSDENAAIRITPEEDKVFYRACAHSFDVIKNKYPIAAMPIERMKPISDVRAMGRLNSYNINVLYIADEIGTALSESRANSNAPVTVGRFKLNRPVKLIDLTGQAGLWQFIYGNKDPRTALSKIISEPLDDEHHRGRSYIPTQVIAEFLYRKCGIDGVIYASQYSHVSHLPIGPVVEGKGANMQMNLDSEEAQGRNYCLFDLDAADCKSVEVWHINKQVNHVTKGAPPDAY